MAPPDLYPQGISLRSIGYAALKYPDLLPELPIPVGNQIGVLQRVPTSEQNHMLAQIGSQYLPALVAYQTSDDPHLHDPNDIQYYFSSALCLLNFLTANPDICMRIAKERQITHDIVEKLLDPDIEKKMRPCKRRMGARYEDDLGTVLQFLSTMLLYSDQSPDPFHPRLAELIPKLKEWKRKYSGIFIGKVSARLIPQIDGPTHPSTIAEMRKKQEETLVCGLKSCGKNKDLNACGQCKIQRYCSQEHQKKDWKYHKHICNKGLVEHKE